MVRIATQLDAAQLEVLNIEFNGDGETTLENIRNSLIKNKQEVIVVDEQNGKLTGFVCVQLKKSFCYDDYMPEITEVYVKPQYRRNGIARNMITYAEEYCKNTIRYINLNCSPARKTMMPRVYMRSWVTVKMANYIWQKGLQGDKVCFYNEDVTRGFYGTKSKKRCKSVNYSR